MKIIVTGGAGFVGSHLCLRLLERGDSVVCLDNFATGIMRNVQPLLEKFPTKFVLLEHDVTMVLPIEKFGDIEQIYHLACPASPADYEQIPLQTLWASAAGTKNMLEVASKKNAAFFLASSSEIYGEPLEHPQRENYFGNADTVGERSCYFEGKRFAESLTFHYWKHFQFPLVMARIFNTYGPQMRPSDGRVIPNFIQAARAGEPLQVYGDGLQTRSFCYVDDLIDLMLVSMETPKYEGPLNFGNPEEVTMLELAKIIVELSGSESLLSFIDLPLGDPLKRRPDILKIQQLFGFEPQVKLREGLQKTLEYFAKFS